MHTIYMRVVLCLQHTYITRDIQSQTGFVNLLRMLLPGAVVFLVERANKVRWFWGVVVWTVFRERDTLTPHFGVDGGGRTKIGGCGEFAG